MKHTDRTKLMTGMKFLAGAMPLAFLGPVVLFSSVKNQDHFLYYPVLAFAILAMAASVFLMFKGIATIMKALFD